MEKVTTQTYKGQFCSRLLFTHLGRAPCKGCITRVDLTNSRTKLQLIKSFEWLGLFSHAPHKILLWKGSFCTFSWLFANPYQKDQLYSYCPLKAWHWSSTSLNWRHCSKKLSLINLWNNTTKSESGIYSLEVTRTSPSFQGEENTLFSLADNSN